MNLTGAYMRVAASTAKLLTCYVKLGALRNAGEPELVVEKVGVLHRSPSVWHEAMRSSHHLRVRPLKGTRQARDTRLLKISVTRPTGKENLLLFKQKLLACQIYFLEWS